MNSFNYLTFWNFLSVSSFLLLTVYMQNLVPVLFNIVNNETPILQLPYLFNFITFIIKNFYNKETEKFK